MLVLILIAYALSNNRKKIPGSSRWVFFAQLIIAIGVIKISWIKIFFEYISSFCKVVGIYPSGNQCCWEFGDVDQYGFVFVFRRCRSSSFFCTNVFALLLGSYRNWLKYWPGTAKAFGNFGIGELGGGWKYFWDKPRLHF